MLTLKPRYIVPFLVFFLVVGILRCFRQRVKHRQLARRWGCKPPTSRLPVKDPIFGLDFLIDGIFGKTSDGYVEPAYQQFKRLGKTYVAERWAFSTVYTCDSANIKQVLASEFESFDLPAVRVSSLSSILGKGIFSLCGAQWSHSRKVWRQVLAINNMAPLDSILERNFQSFLSHIPQDGSTVSLARLFFWLAMDIATELLFDNSTSMLDRARIHDSERQFVEDYMVCSSEAIKRMQWGPLGPFLQSWKLGQAKGRIFSYIDNFIEESLQKKLPLHGGRALHELKRQGLNKQEMRDQVLHILLASRDTTASVLGNIFFFFGKKPEVFAKVRNEVISIAGTECPTEEQLRQMEYLRWCMQECERPPSP